jgi:hypothetical protein
MVISVLVILQSGSDESRSEGVDSATVRMNEDHRQDAPGSGPSCSRHQAVSYSLSDPSSRLGSN